jgi:AcrR family transcriptional regulator
MNRDRTADNIKAAARRLFGEKGFANVSVREIVAAAGQKNGGSLNYYFASKEKLLEEILVEGAKIWDSDRNRRLDRLEAAGGPKTLRELVSATFNPNVEQRDAMTYYRLFRSVMTDEHEIYSRVVGHAFDSGFRRAVAHARRLLPSVPWPLLAERLQFAIMYVSATLATRTPLGATGEYWARFWSSKTAEQTLFDTLEGMLRQPPSREALLALEKRTRKAPTSASVARGAGAMSHIAELHAPSQASPIHRTRRRNSKTVVGRMRS